MTERASSDAIEAIFCSYSSLSRKTERFDRRDLLPIVQGLFGEVGSLMSTVKKYHREHHVYTAFGESIVEEFGDVLWYFSSLCRRFDQNLVVITREAVKDIDFRHAISVHRTQRTLAEIEHLSVCPLELDELLITFGRESSNLLSLDRVTPRTQRKRLLRFARIYLRLVLAFGVSLHQITKTNLKKTHGRFLIPNSDELTEFDTSFPLSERLPSVIRANFSLCASGQCHLTVNGELVGQRLTDNIQDQDGYKFHDVFHIAYASILHWSPVLRKLVDCKRKSDPCVDENEDGGHAAVIEEGLSAYIFTRAKELTYFSGHQELSFDLLKVVKNFVRGFEVEQCPLSLWEQAILRGYEAFRMLKGNNGGTVIADRNTRSISYMSKPE